MSLSQLQAFARISIVTHKISQVDDSLHIFCRKGFENRFKGFLVTMNIRKNGNPSHYSQHHSLGSLLAECVPKTGWRSFAIPMTIQEPFHSRILNAGEGDRTMLSHNPLML